MNVLESLWHSFWWVLPLLPLRYRNARREWVQGFGFRSWGTDSRNLLPMDSEIAILDKRYTLGEVGREEYEERKRSPS